MRGGKSSGSGLKWAEGGAAPGTSTGRAEVHGMVGLGGEPALLGGAQGGDPPDLGGVVGGGGVEVCPLTVFSSLW